MQTLMVFFHLLSWFSVRQLRVHPWRVLAVLFGIGLGAAVFGSVRLAVNASVDSFTRSMDHLSGKADLVATLPGNRVPEALVAEIWKDPVVKAVSPLITSYVQVSGNDEPPFLLIGLDPILDRSLRTWQTDSLSEDTANIWQELMRIPYAILLSRRLAQRMGVKPEDTLTLEHVNQIAEFRVLGLLDNQGLALVEGGNVALADIATMQEFTGLHGSVDRIDIALKDYTKAEGIRRLQTRLPHGMMLEAPSETKETGQMLIRAYQLNLSVLSFVSLFVGMFLVYSMGTLNATSRRRELAILRALGASSRLIFALFLAEGALLGMMGWLMALPIGSLLARYLPGWVSSTINDLFVRVQVEGLQLDKWEMVLSFFLTVLISLFAAYGPAREAKQIPPREALIMHDTTAQKRKTHLRLTLVGLLLMAVSWPLSRVPGLPGLPLAGYVAVFSLFLGFALLSPWFLDVMGSYLPAPLRHLGGEPAFLGARYIKDAGKRSAVSVGALVTAMALFAALVITVHSFRYTVALWIDQSLSGDVFLRAKMAGFNQYRDALPPEVVRGLKSLSAGTELLPYRRISLKYGKIPYQLEATDLRLFMEHGKFLLLEGDMKRISRQLIEGKGVVVSEVFSNQTGLRIGQRFRAKLGNALLDLPVLGICRDYRTRGGAVFITLATLEAITGENEWSGARFFFLDRDRDMAAAASQLKSKIMRRCGQIHPLEIATGSELRRDILRIFDETFTITTVLLIIALLVAGLGITTTLTVLVLERIGQLNTLLAVGATSGQIRSMIFWEAILMVTAGEAIGLICGFFLSHLLIFVINRQSFGWTFLFRIDWGFLGMSLPLILATALAAALPATRLVLRSSPALVLKEP